MSLVEDLLIILSDYRGDYVETCTRLRRYIYARSDARSENLNIKPTRSFSDNTLRVTLSKLKQKGLVNNKNRKWEITSLGLDYLDKIQDKPKMPSHSSRNSKKKTKKIIVVFDIPEKERNKRTWLRIELVNLGFEMLQQSVWFGPTPLPEKFIKSLNDLKLLPYIKFFKATETDVV